MKPWNSSNVAQAILSSGVTFTAGRHDGVPMMHIPSYRPGYRPVTSPWARAALVEHLVKHAGLAPPPAGMFEPLDVFVAGGGVMTSPKQTNAASSPAAAFPATTNVISKPTDGTYVASLPRLCTTNARGYNCGTSNGACRYPDATVAEARRLRAAGMTLRAIGEQLGVPFGTISDWNDGTSRPDPARVIVRGPPRRKQP